MAELRDKLRVPAAGEPAREPGDAAASAGERTGEQGGGGGSRARAARLVPSHSDARNFSAKDEFLHWESHLANRLGIDRREIIRLRQKHLTENSDFVKNGRRLLYSPSGAQKLAKLVLPADELEKWLPTSVLEEPQADSQALYEFTVRKKSHNAHVLECLDDDKAVVVVRVRDSSNFLPGMRVTAVPYGKLHNVFEFVGPYPRYRGKY